MAILAPNAVQYFRDNEGKPLSGGYVETYEIDGITPKAAFEDPGEVVALSNPIRLDQNGGKIIYWDQDALYAIKVFDKNGVPVFNENNYPFVDGSGGGSPVNNFVTVDNFFRNEQFTFWREGKETFTNDDLPIGTTETATDWYFERTNDASNVTISRQAFGGGVTVPGSTPIYYIRYVSDGAAGDAANRHKQIFQDVHSLNGRIVNVYFVARTGVPGTTSTVKLQYEQFFGTGGAPDPTNIQDVNTFNIDENWQIYNISFTINSTAGRNLGTNGDDYLSIMLQPQISQPITIDIANGKFELEDPTETYPYETPDEQFVRILPGALKETEDDRGANLVQYTPQQTVREALDGAVKNNILVGSYFVNNPRQLGQANTASTAFPNNDASYIMDQTILLSDGNDVVEIFPGTGTEYFNSVITASGAGKKFGVMNIVEFQDVLSIREGEGRVSMRVRLALNNINSVKIALLGWSGVANSPTIDPILNWNPGAEPTLVPNWSYLPNSSGDTFTEITTMGSLLEETFVDIPIGPTINNIAAFVWSEDLTSAPLSGLVIDKIHLNHGGSASGFDNITAGEEFERCQRYIQTSLQAGAAAYPSVPALDSSPYLFDIKLASLINFGSVYTLTLSNEQLLQPILNKLVSIGTGIPTVNISDPLGANPNSCRVTIALESGDPFPGHLPQTVLTAAFGSGTHRNMRLTIPPFNIILQEGVSYDLRCVVHFDYLIRAHY